MSNKASDIASDAVGTVSKAFKKMTEDATAGWGMFARVADKLFTGISGMISPFSKVQSAAAELARSMGLSGKRIMNMSQTMVAANQKLSLSMRYGLSNEEMMGLQGTIMNALGRNVAISTAATLVRNEKGEIVNPDEGSELNNIAAMQGAGFSPDMIGDMVAGFDRVGKSMNAAAKASGKLYKEAGQYGINLQKYAQNFTQNLQMVQTFNFRKGVDGLREMARKATEIRQDMQQVARFAEKVGSVTGAVETAARLQVLGGSFTAMANPLAMLNESMTNMEGLQDRLINMTKGAATYNSQTHQIEMDPVTRMRIKMAAEAAGVDASNMIDQAYAQARKSEIESQMSGIGNLSDEFKKLVSNIGEINSETGVAGVTDDKGIFHSLAEIANMTPDAQKEFQEKLIASNRSESEDIKVIAQNVQDIERTLKGRREQLANEMAANITKPGVIEGQTIWDTAVDTVINGFNEKFIEAVGRMDFPLQSLEKNFMLSFQKSIGELGQSVAANSMDEFKAQFGTAWKNVFGDSELSKNIEGTFEKIFGSLKHVAENINEYTIDKANVDMIGATMKSFSEGMPASVTISPIKVGEGATGTAAAIKGTVSGIKGTNETQDVKPGQAQESPEIKGNKDSVPATTVNKDASFHSQRVYEYQNPGEIIVRLSFDGTLKIDGDNGTIGVEDVKKILPDVLRQNDNLERELAKRIAEQLQGREGLVAEKSSV